MFSILLFIHTVLCLTLIGLVLIQQGKGADMGAAFGGGSNTVFGAGGAADFITRLTTGMAIAFMVSSVFLVKAYSSNASMIAAQQGPTVETVDALAGSVMEGVQAPTPAASVTASNEKTVVVPAAVVEVPVVQVTSAPVASAAATVK